MTKRLRVVVAMPRFSRPTASQRVVGDLRSTLIVIGLHHSSALARLLQQEAATRLAHYELWSQDLHQYIRSVQVQSGQICRVCCCRCRMDSLHAACASVLSRELGTGRTPSRLRCARKATYRDIVGFPRRRRRRLQPVLVEDYKADTCTWILFAATFPDELTK